MKHILTLLMITCPCLASPPAAKSPKLADGKGRQFSRDIRLTDVLNHKWVDELVTYDLDFAAGQATLDSIRLYDVDHGKELPFQLSKVSFHDRKGEFIKSAVIAFFVDELPAMGARNYTVLWDPGAFASASQPAAALKETDLKAETFEVTNGLFGVRLAGRKRFDAPADASTVAGPLRGFKGPDGVWRATSRFVTDAKVLGWKAELLERGPLWKLYRVRFEFDGGRFYELELKMVVDHPYAYVTERNNFRLRIAELPHPLCGESGHMAHGRNYIRWGVADQLRILMKENFDPDVCYTPETFCYGFAQDPLKHDEVKVWTAVRPVFPSVDAPWLGTYSTDEKKNDLIAIVGRDAAHWEYPDSSINPHHLTPGVNAEIHFVDEPGEHAYYRIPVARAVRHWLLAVGDKREWTKLRYPGGNQSAYPYLAHLRTKVCDLPLDKVKDWRLDWEQKLPGEPRLFFSPAQAQALWKRIEAHEPFKPYLPKVKGLLTGEGGAKTVRSVGAHTGENMVDLLFRVGYSGFVQSISIARPMRGVAEALDYNARTLDAAQVARTRREMAFLTSALIDGDYWQYAWNRERTSYLPNFGSDLYLAVGLMALVLPDHPNSRLWLQYTLGELDKEFTYYISPDGAGEENVANYYLWTWRQFTPLLGALKHNGIFDAGRHPRYQAACRFWIEVLTPPQAKLAAYAAAAPVRPEERLRRIPPFGDHGYNNRVVTELGGQTGILKDANPQLAAESAWAWWETCRKRPATHMGVIPHLLVADPTVAPRVPVLRSRRLRGLGAILRNHFPSGKETYLAIKASRIYSHHQPDEGAIHLFGRGVPIILDALHPDDPASCYREDWHPIVSFADGKTHRRGKVIEFRTSPLADFVAADIPVGPFLPGPPEPGMTRNGSRRQILLVKSPTLDVPDYFVLQDIVYGPAASQLNLPVFCGKPQVGAGGKANHVLLPPIDSPNYGVATDLIFLSPAAPDIAVSPITKGEGGEHAWAVSARQPAGRNWAVVIYPRDKEMAPPTVETLGSANAFRLTSPGKLAIDYVVAAPGPTSAQADEFRFTGQRGVARLRDGRVSTSLIDGTEIRCRQIGVFGKGPVWLTQTATGFTGGADGPRRDVYLLLGREWTSDLVLTLNGKRKKLSSPNGILAVELPAGRCEFAIEKP
ncbi:MAG TPA: hypothetical protein VNA25_14625 [Phycisphaerae bacterium]|nr:hypothetical protein [Phycisphaerae bacterium]